MDPEIFVALDCVPTEAKKIIDNLCPIHCGIKIGKELFTWAGPQVVEYCNNLGFKVFLDLKYHDIPNTVAKAAIALASHNIFMFTVHALGGHRMLEATRTAIDDLELETPPKILAVTLLTSMEENDVNKLNVLNGNPKEIATNLCKVALDAKVDGIVCSPLESSQLRNNFGNDFIIVTPGVRPQESSNNDQKRVATPSEAIASGSNFLVIGRPITSALDPNTALLKIYEEISSNTKNVEILTF
ncbi:MAG: orotidine-5'-phosphate decarboxylase [Francisellaceae bacterium]|nr:orotidine-5'-phosphate decarboxylase [Francisellaceae bacterium]MBT6206704.1 orotidine-5'-phosphate decarboxylase [Francisellaceae bacterium]MBT6537958.1 orotidine-5'-phosphate decarboxylase [Francisellaceae bacterium]